MPRIHKPRMRKTQIWGDTLPQIRTLSGCKSAGERATLEPERTCAPELLGTKSPRSFCDAWVPVDRCGGSSPDSTQDSRCGSCFSVCLYIQSIFQSCPPCYSGPTYLENGTVTSGHQLHCPISELFITPVPHDQLLISIQQQFQSHSQTSLP